jgi:hypothetical protein
MRGLRRPTAPQRLSSSHERSHVASSTDILMHGREGL